MNQQDIVEENKTDVVSSTGKRGKKSFGRPNQNRSNQGPVVDAKESGFEDKVVKLGRCATVTKGGRRFSFSALVVIGDKKGQVGSGYGKAGEVPDAIKKANEDAQKSLVTIKLKGTTIPHEVIGKSDGAVVLLKPASQGTGLKAAGGVRAVLELAGIQDVLTKSLGSSNPASLVNATLNALKSLRMPEDFKAMLRS